MKYRMRRRASDQKLRRRSGLRHLLDASLDQDRSGAEELDSEGRSVTSETTSHTSETTSPTDTETIDADDERVSLESEPFSSGPDDDEGSQRGPTSTLASDDGDGNGDDVSLSSPRSSRRVTFDENAPETVMFTPEPGGGRRVGDEEDSEMAASTDSDSEESAEDSFKTVVGAAARAQSHADRSIP